MMDKNRMIVTLNGVSVSVEGLHPSSVTPLITVVDRETATTMAALDAIMDGSGRINMAVWVYLKGQKANLNALMEALMERQKEDNNAQA